MRLHASPYFSGCRERREALSCRAAISEFRWPRIGVHIRLSRGVRPGPCSEGAIRLSATGYTSTAHISHAATARLVQETFRTMLTHGGVLDTLRLRYRDDPTGNGVTLLSSSLMLRLAARPRGKRDLLVAMVDSDSDVLLQFQPLLKRRSVRLAAVQTKRGEEKEAKQLTLIATRCYSLSRL
jgi:hypothetical protein